MSDANEKVSCRYLHSEAVEAGIEIWDTGERTLAESVEHIVGYLRR